MIDLAFTKGGGKMDRLEVTRPDGRREQIDCPKQRILPHDMVHYAIERQLAHRGFLAMVREGTALAYDSLGGDEAESVERLVEAFQAAMWSQDDTPAAASDANIRYAYAMACEARGNRLLAVGDDDIAAIRADLDRLTRAWEALAVGETLRLTF